MDAASLVFAHTYNVCLFLLRVGTFVVCRKMPVFSKPGRQLEWYNTSRGTLFAPWHLAKLFNVLTKIGKPLTNSRDST